MVCPLALRNQRCTLLLCKDEVEDCSHFFLSCETFKANFSSLWQNLNLKILLSNPTDGTFICSFLSNLDQNNKILFLLGGLPLPFQVETSIMIRRFVSSAAGKICKIRTDKLSELEAPWLTLQQLRFLKMASFYTLCNQLYFVLNCCNTCII